MKTMHLAVLLASAAAVVACADKSGEDAVLAPIPPLAYTRFVNGVADTGATDWRFVDQLEYSPVELGRTFRTFSPYAGTAPGSRRLKIFPTSTDITVTQQHFIDTTMSLTAGKYYTIIHTGYARTGSTPADYVIVLEDSIPATVATTNYAVRAVNVGTGLGTVDVYAVASTSTSIVGVTPLFSAVTFGKATTYSSTLTLGAMAFRAATAGTTTVLASTTAPAGSAADATNNLTAVGGTTIGSSVITGFLFPASVVGSAAPQTTAFTSPAIVFLVDRHPR